LRVKKILEDIKVTVTNSDSYKRLVNRIIGESLANDMTVLFRARILVNAWIIFFIAFVVTAVVLSVSPITKEARLSGMALCFFLALNLLLMLITFRSSGNYRLYGHISIAIAFVGITIAVSIFGTPIYSPSIGLFYLLPVLAVFFLGKSACWLWSFICFVTILGFTYLDLNNFPFPSLYDVTFLWETRLLSVLIGVIGVVGMVATYESSNEKLRNDKNMEYQRLEFLARNDQLTKLLNRLSFEEKIEQSIAKLGLVQKHEKLALIYMDLDGFKPINDNFGHKAGDWVLVKIAERINSLLQEKGYAARHGGDEFLLLLEHVKKTEDIMKFVEHLLQEICKPIYYETLELKVTASIGVALFPKDAQDISTLIRNADIAMYQAKSEKNMFVFFENK